MGSIFPCALATDPFKAALFDKPLHESHAPLPPDPLNPQAKATLSCYYYPHLMVKQIDLGEEGAAEVSFTFIPKDLQEPPCLRKKAKDEKDVDFNGGAVYFQGVKGDYVFFIAADGSNGAMGFSIFNDSGISIFDFVLGDHFKTGHT
jgi:hypothetical protein